jgi:hypothetical protein
MRHIKLFGTLLITGILFGCGGGGGGAGSITPVTSQQVTPMAVFVTGNVVNTSTTTTGVASDITITGTGLPALYTWSGSPLATTFASENDGTFKFALKQVPATDVTVTITAKAKASGYITNSYNLVIKSGTQFGALLNFFSIPLVSTSVPVLTPKGVVNGTTTGTTSTDLSVTAANTVTKAATTVTIPQGTVASSGSTSLSGTLTLTTTNYSPQEASALMLAPNDGTTFITGGFTDVSLSDGSHSATSLSKEMDIRMDIATNTPNPETGAPIAEGDKITVYTYKTATGKWEPETSINDGINGPGVTLVKKDLVDQLYITFKANHFSYWNLGYKFGVVTCPNKTINLTSANGTDHKAPLTLMATNPPSTYYSAIKPPNDTSITVANVPKNSGMTYQAFYGTNLVTPVGTLVTLLASACSTQTMTILLPSSLLDYNWYTYRQCQYPPYNTQPLSNFSIYSCPPGTTTLQPFPTCTIVGITNGSGLASFAGTPGYSIFIKSNDQYTTCPTKSAVLPGGTNPPAIQGESNCVGNWDFCPNTGAGGGSPLPL